MSAPGNGAWLAANPAILAETVAAWWQLPKQWALQTGEAAAPVDDSARVEWGTSSRSLTYGLVYFWQILCCPAFLEVLGHDLTQDLDNGAAYMGQ